MQGTIVDKHHRLALKLVTAAPSSLELTFSFGDATAEMIILRNTGYIRANARFWTSQGAPNVTRLAGRWIEVPAANAHSLTAGFGTFAPGTLARCLTEDHGTLTTAGRAQVDGRPVILVKDAGDKPGSSPSVLAVAATGAPYPLRFTATGGQRAGGRIDVCNTGKASDVHGMVRFSHFGRVAPIHAPKNVDRVPAAPTA